MPMRRNRPQVGSVSFSPAAGAANISLVTITIKDDDGVAINRSSEIEVWLSDSATGLGLTSTTASGAVAAGASGTDLSVLTTKKHLRCQTNTSGVYILSITDTGKTGFYVACRVEGSILPLQISSQLVSGNYG